MNEKLGRALMGAGALTRLSYGLGALLVPDAMCSRRLAPDIRGHADGRMDFRGFGGLHISVALLTLRAAVQNRNTRLLLGLNVGCELTDLAATLLEWRDRNRADLTVRGSLAVASAGLVTWIAALGSLPSGNPPAQAISCADGANEAVSRGKTRARGLSRGRHLRAPRG